MNWEYISGFFDADGSIFVTKQNKNRQHSLNITFTNNEISILEDIQKFIDKELSIKGIIVSKLPKKDIHCIGFELRYNNYQAFVVSNKLISRHPKKINRIELYRQIQVLTIRNGKYSNENLLKRNKLIEIFNSNQ